APSVGRAAGRARAAWARRADGSCGARARAFLSGAELFPPGRAAESEGGLVFVIGDPNDAGSEAGCGVRLDARVRFCWIDPLRDVSHLQSGVPLLDMRDLQSPTH